jgi:choline transport protein
MNLFFIRWLPAVEIGSLVIFLSGFVVVIVTITVFSPSKASAHEVFQVFINQGGWSSQGVSWWVGVQGVIFAWLGTDGAIHMAEEVRSASRVLPTTLMVSVLVNGCLGFAVLIAVLFCGGDLISALGSPTGFP